MKSATLRRERAGVARYLDVRQELDQAVPIHSPNLFARDSVLDRGWLARVLAVLGVERR